MSTTELGPSASPEAFPCSPRLSFLSQLLEVIPIDRMREQGYSPHEGREGEGCETAVA